MPNPELGRARLVAQGLVTRPFATPAAAVRGFGAMQGQDLPGAMASAALRTPSGDVAPVIVAMDAGEIVRGYPMRGTVFLVAAEDLLWMSELCNASALKAAERRRGQLGLDATHVAAALDEAGVALTENPRGLARAALFERWEVVGTPTDKGRGYHVLAHLIGQRHLAYGPWNGTDQNIVLSASWLPAASDLAGRFDGDRTAAVAHLLRTYLDSHGPATIRDFAWWTKLSLTEIRRALPLVAGELESDGEPEASYWRPGLRDEVIAVGKMVDRPLLLPGFDEFILGYQDRMFAMTPDEHSRVVPGNNGIFGRTVVIDGVVRGIWKRAGRPGKRALEVESFGKLRKSDETALATRFEGFPFANA